MAEWTASLCIEPSSSRYYPRVQEMISGLPAAKNTGDEKEPIWEAEVGLDEYETFVEICRLAAGWKGFEAHTRGINIEWRRHQRPLLCGQNRRRHEPNGHALFESGLRAGAQKIGHVGNVSFNKFYGTVTIKFEHGKVTHVEMNTRRSYKFKDLPRDEAYPGDYQEQLQNRGKPR